jgi:hypothetical protein
MRPFRPGESYGVQFVTRGSTGLVNADSTPTVVMSRNGIDDGTVTFAVSNPATGRYRATATIPSGYAPGDRLEVIVTATVAGFTDTEIVERIRLVGPDFTLSVNLANLDAQVSSRLPTASYTAPDNATIGLIYGTVDSEIGAIKAKTDLLSFDGNNAVLSRMSSGERNAIAVALLDLADGVETGETPRQWMRLVRSVLAGQGATSGASPNITTAYRRKDGSTTAITVIYDEDGNRTSSTPGTL